MKYRLCYQGVLKDRLTALRKVRCKSWPIVVLASRVPRARAPGVPRRGEEHRGAEAVSSPGVDG